MCFLFQSLALTCKSGDRCLRLPKPSNPFLKLNFRGERHCGEWEALQLCATRILFIVKFTPRRGLLGCLARRNFRVAPRGGLSSCFISKRNSNRQLAYTDIFYFAPYAKNFGVASRGRLSTFSIPGDYRSAPRRRLSTYPVRRTSTCTIPKASKIVAPSQTLGILAPSNAFSKCPTWRTCNLFATGPLFQITPRKHLRCAVCHPTFIYNLRAQDLTLADSQQERGHRTPQRVVV